MLNANSLSDFVDHLGSEMKFAGAWARTCEFFAGQGLPWVCYGYADVDKDAALSVPTLKSNVRDDFLNRWVFWKTNFYYFSKGFAFKHEFRF